MLWSCGGRASVITTVGRKVLSTFYTNSAEGAVTRLAGLGVPDFVVREVLRGVLAQDLVGVWCRECRDEGCAACAGRVARARRSGGGGGWG